LQIVFACYVKLFTGARLYFLFLAAVLIYCGIWALKIQLYNWKGKDSEEFAKNHSRSGWR